MGTKKTIAAAAMFVGAVALCTATCCLPCPAPTAPPPPTGTVLVPPSVDGGAEAATPDAALDAELPDADAALTPSPTPPSSTSCAAKDFCALAKKVCAP
jgi:hypothetical protein